MVRCRSCNPRPGRCNPHPERLPPGALPDLHTALLALGFRKSWESDGPIRTVEYRPDGPRGQTFAVSWHRHEGGAEVWSGDPHDEFLWRNASDAIDRKGQRPAVSEWRRELAARVRAAESLMGAAGGQVSLL